MARELTITLGVLAERRRSISRWSSDYWIPVGVTLDFDRLTPGDVLIGDETMTRYFMGTHDLVCHAAETEAYVHNFNSRTPALYVVLRRSHEGGSPLDWFVQSVTASPYLAQDHEDSGEDIVERVAMPPDVGAAIMGFVDYYHKDEPFRKRRRDRLDAEEHKFGQEPIFSRPGRPRGGGSDA